MAKSSNAVRIEVEEEGWEDSGTTDNTCPECATESVATYMDRYSSYEYCTNCDWSDEDSDVPTREQIGRSDRRYQED